MATPAVKVVSYQIIAGKIIQAQVGLRLRLAGDMIATKMKKNINISTRRFGPSAPGEKPHKDTGKLQQSIQVGMEKDEAVAVGAHVDYALKLELGDPGMAARPFIRPTFNEMLPVIRNLFS